MDSEGHMGITGNARHIMAYPGNLTESIREIGDVLTTSLGKRNLMASRKLSASSRRNVCKCHVIWLILVSWGSCCFTKQMISRPGCKAFEYVKKNGLSRFLQKSQTQHRPRPPESGIRNPPDLTLGESWLGNGSIPINTIFSGMNIHKSQLFWCELKRGTIGFDTHPLQRNQPSPAPWQAHHPCGNQQGRELMLWRRRPRVVTTMHVLRSLWPTSCHPAFKRFSVWRTQWAVTIPDCNMINMIYMIVIWL